MLLGLRKRLIKGVPMAEEVTRRSFVKGAGAAAGAAAGIAAAGTLASSAAFAAESGAQDASGAWDESADVVVVGSGTATVAAIAAEQFGAEKVVLLEKGATFGGTTIMSGQGCGIPCNHVWEEAGAAVPAEQVLEYYENASAWRVDPEVAQSYIDHGDEYLRWTEDTFGFSWGFSSFLPGAYSDYYDPVPGYNGSDGPISVVSIGGDENQSNQWAFWQTHIDQSDVIDLRLSTAATSLVTDGSGKVCGVVATDADGNEMRIEAKLGVVLGTGGFEWNADMRRQYLPFPLLKSASVATNTGDGQKMAQRIGADLSNMDRCWGLPFIMGLSEGAPADLIAADTITAGMTDSDSGTYRGLPGTVIVNSKGKRVANEAASYDTFNRVFGNFDTDTSTLSNIPLYWIFDSSYVFPFSMVYSQPGTDADGNIDETYYAKADTFEELAEKLGIDPDGLAATMEAFNENAAAGTDPEWHRGEHDYDVNTAGLYAQALAGVDTGTDNPTLSPLATPPYYGCLYVPGTFGTCGGVRINGYAQALDVDGEVIEGLYAVGNCSMGVAGGIYAHGGITVGQGSVMSYVAAKKMFGLE
jgi:3-oxosteroid 1-dehydrogenase